MRIITRELIEVNEHVTMLLITPPPEHIQILACDNNPNDCNNNNKSNLASSPADETNITLCSFLKSSAHIYLPVQLFEAVHLSAYDAAFVRKYVLISIQLEIEHLASLQFNREAFSNDEMIASKRILGLVGRYQRSLEEIWKEYRWLIEAINTAREKDKSQQQQNAATSIVIADLKLFVSNVYKNKEKIKFLNCCKCFLESLSSSNRWPKNLTNNKDIYNQITALDNELMLDQECWETRELVYDESLKNFICNCAKSHAVKSTSKVLVGVSELSKMGHSSFNHIDSVLLDDYELDQVRLLDRRKTPS